ncbi:MAG TPA: DMT family transporter [Burkholderiales bacterium]|nr:DMT family transporter [Burkholderiales bacterium]
MTPGDSGRLDARASGLAILAMAILGGSYTAGKIALHDLPVFGLLALRMAITTVTLGAYAALTRLPLLQTGRSAAYVLAQTGFFLVSQVSLFIGLTMTGAGRAAILFNMQPFFTLLLLPLWVPAERIGLRRWLGTIAAFGGVALVLVERGTAGGSLLGDALCLLAALGWSGNVILNKRMPREVNSAALIFWNVAAAIPVVAVLALALEGGATWHFSASAVASLLYLGVVAAGLGFVLIVWLVRSYSASRVNVFVFLSPVFGVLIGWLLLAEPISLQQALGALGVAAGILIVSTER